MIDRKLLRFIKKQLKRKVPKNRIEEDLENVGWNKADIELAFAYLHEKRRISAFWGNVKSALLRQKILSIVILALAVLVVIGFIFQDYLPLVEVTPSSFVKKECAWSGEQGAPRFFRKGGKFYWEVTDSAFPDSPERKVIQEIDKEEYLRVYQDNKSLDCGGRNFDNFESQPENQTGQNQ